MRLKQRGKEAARRLGGPAERNGAGLGRAGGQGLATSEYGVALSSLRFLFSTSTFSTGRGW